MAFHLSFAHIGRSLERAAAEQLEAILADLIPESVDEAAVHDARKRLKKLQAVLSIVPKSVVRARRDRDALRAAGRLLGAARDAHVLPETLLTLQRRYSDVIASSFAERVSAALRKGQPPIDGPRVIALLTHASRHLPKRLSNVDAFSALRPGVAKGYKQCASAMASLDESSGGAEFHRWRRRVKTHWYHVRLLGPRKTSRRDRAARLKVLETTLGDEHNLTVLAEVLLQHPRRFGGQRETAVVLGCIQDRQRALRRQALRHGHRLFGMAPGRFDEMVQRWRHARRER